MQMTTPEIHPEIAHLAWLLGTWTGEGAGEYPTIESFTYTEHVTFAHVGKPFFSYNQKTKHAETGLPLHAESGYLRAVGLDRVELLNVQPSGIMEIYEGAVDGSSLDLVAVHIAGSATAKDVAEVARQITVDEPGETLSYRLQMAAVGQPLQHHLAATLHRQP